MAYGPSDSVYVTSDPNSPLVLDCVPSFRLEFLRLASDEIDYLFVLRIVWIEETSLTISLRCEFCGNVWCDKFVWCSLFISFTCFICSDGATVKWLVDEAELSENTAGVVLDFQQRRVTISPSSPLLKVLSLLHLGHWCRSLLLVRWKWYESIVQVWPDRCFVSCSAASRLYFLNLQIWCAELLGVCTIIHAQLLLVHSLWGRSLRSCLNFWIGLCCLSSLFEEIKSSMISQQGDSGIQNWWQISLAFQKKDSISVQCRVSAASGRVFDQKRATIRILSMFNLKIFFRWNLLLCFTCSIFILSTEPFVPLEL